MLGLPETFLQLAFVEELIGTYRWVWSLSEVLHFVGLILLVGIVTILDLRLLGIAKRIPYAALRQLLPWAVFGFNCSPTSPSAPVAASGSGKTTVASVKKFAPTAVLEPEPIARSRVDPSAEAKPALSMMRSPKGCASDFRKIVPAPPGSRPSAPSAWIRLRSNPAASP